MKFSRVLTVFRKELDDVLRDRRTVIATIVVPVCLYPLLMLLSLQAVSSQQAQVAEEDVVVGVVSREAIEPFADLMEEERAALEAAGREGSAEGGEAGGGGAAPTPLSRRVDVRVVPDLRQAVLDRRVHVGVEVVDSSAGGPEPQVTAKLVYQPAEIRSNAGALRVEEMLRRVRQARVDARLASLGLDRRAIEPVRIETDRVSTPGSLLGLILPSVLVLMTVTSAIYPAIDLTAGERERGTLESLLVCPVPPLELVVGKFLTVAAIALLGAGLNLGSVAATSYFGGLGELLAAGSQSAGAFPWAALPVILVSMIPFSVLISAVLVAVASCARSFKEAQNYMTPVMMAVLLPAMAGSLPGAKLEGLMLVMPVGNVVLLVRELLGNVPVGVTSVAWVLLSTCAYAAAAVVIAAQAFAKETVMFADSVSLQALLSRKVARPRRLPTMTMPALYAALLFPVWFYLQTALQQASGGDIAALLRHTSVFMPLLFAAVPIAMLWYWKVDIRQTLALRAPTARHLVAGGLLGLAMWVVAHEVFVLQQNLAPTPPELLESGAAFEQTLREQPLALMLLFIAVVPAVSEELFFRGFLQSGLATSAKKWTVLVVVSVAFALFHFFLFRFGTTFVLGLVLAWLCWQGRSIWPAILAHALNNGQAVLNARYPAWQESLGVSERIEHLPWPVLLGGLAVVAAGLALAWKPAGDRESPGAAPADAVPA